MRTPAGRLADPHDDDDRANGLALRVISDDGARDRTYADNALGSAQAISPGAPCVWCVCRASVGHTECICTSHGDSSDGIQGIASHHHAYQAYDII